MPLLEQCFREDAFCSTTGTISLLFHEASSPGRSEVVRKGVISVIGGTGLQGGGVVDALLAQGRLEVRVATRNPASDGARALSARGEPVAATSTAS